jgi:uncharacterized protein
LITVLDTSVLVALMDIRDDGHRLAAEWYARTEDALITTPLVLAEADYVARRGGGAASAALRGDLISGAWTVDWWDSAPSEIAEVAEAYEDLRLSLTDASLVALAARVGTRRIATYDERDFRVVRPLDGPGAFTLLPADA